MEFDHKIFRLNFGDFMNIPIAVPYTAMDQSSQSCEWRNWPSAITTTTATLGWVLVVCCPTIYGLCKAHDRDYPNDQTTSGTYDGLIKATEAGGITIAASVATAVAVTVIRAANNGYSNIRNGGRAACSAIGSALYDSIRWTKLDEPEGYLINTIVGPFKCFASCCNSLSRARVEED